MSVSRLTLFKVVFSLVSIFALTAVMGAYSVTPTQVTTEGSNDHSNVSNSESAIKDIDKEITMVRRVIDGNTIEVDTGDTVRYIGVSVPLEHAEQATEFNTKLVDGEMVRLAFDIRKRDSESRVLAYVYLANGTFINAEIIRQGHAVASMVTPNFKYYRKFSMLEEEAKSERRGLWFKPTFSQRLDMAGDSSEQRDDYIRGRVDGSLDAQGDPAWVIAGLGCGVFGVGAAYIYDPEPPLEILAGKSSEYIVGYTETYRSKKRSGNLKYAAAGLVAWIAFVFLIATSNL